MENIYELLELDIEPRPQFKTLDEIKKAIESKKRKLNQSARGSSEAKNKQKIAELQILAEDLTIDKFNSAYEEAKAKMIKELSSEVKYLENNEISEKKAGSLAKQYKVTLAFICREFSLKIVKETNGGKESETMPEPKCKGKMDTNKARFQQLDKKDLYDFLNYEGAEERLPAIRRKSAKDLQAMADSLSSRFTANDENSSAGSKLIALAKEIFANQESKDDYDYYIDEFEPILPVFRKIPRIAENKTLTGNQGELLIEEINLFVKDTERSRRLLRGKCKELKIIWQEAPDKSIAYCVFCGRKINASDEVCGKCGKKQYVICKKCGQKSRADSKFCTNCSQPFGDMKKVSKFCDAARDEIKMLNFNVAKHFISQAESEGGMTDEISKVQQFLKKVEMEVGAQVQQLERTKENKSYYKANQLINDIKKMYPAYENDALETIIGDVLAKAKILFDKASKTKNPEERLTACANIRQMCSDYPGVADLESDIPLDAPTGITVRTDNRRKTNVISWDYKGLAAGVEFTVVRKGYAKPVNIDDGIKIGHFSGRSCSDNNIEAGVEYYYAVFAGRGNNYSQPGSTLSPTVNVFNVERVSVNPGDGVVSIQWLNNTNGQVRIWRKENSVPSKEKDGLEVQNITSNGALDNSVKNGHCYGYYLCTEYCIGEKILYSEGITFNNIMPDVPPQVVTFLFSEMSETSKQIFHLEWDDDVQDTVKFYSSPKALEWDENTSIGKTQLESKAIPINVSVNEAGKGTVNIGNVGELYITAVTVKGENCVIGANTYVSNKQLFKITETRMVHGDLHIFLNEWPDECVSLKVLYRNDSYPKTANDKTAEKFICVKSVYNQSKTVVIRQALQQDYYISIFGKLSGDKGYAPAVSVFFSNKAKSVISYELLVKKNLLGKITNVSIAFTGLEEFSLPALLVYKNAGFLPPNMSVGRKIKEIAASSNLQKQYVIDIGKDFNKNDYVKVFLQNSQDSVFYEINAVSSLNVSN